MVVRLSPILISKALCTKYIMGGIVLIILVLVGVIALLQGAILPSITMLIIGIGGSILAEW